MDFTRHFIIDTTLDMNLFYANPADIVNSTITIRGQEANHISRVMRHSVGDELQVTDGTGNLFTCIIDHIQKDQLTAKIQSSEKSEKATPQVTLCMGMIKKRDRLEFAIEKAVELGVDEIILFVGDNSERTKVRIDRLEGVVLSAMKQSLRNHLPSVRFKKSLIDVIRLNPDDFQIVVADEKSGLSDEILSSGISNYLLIVGPEGGFSDKERQFLNSFNTITCSLGKKRLRAETAAIVMVDRFKNQHK